MKHKLFKVIIQLYAMVFQSCKDTWTGRVVSTGSLKIDDVIELAVSRRTDLNPATLKAGYEILKEVVLEQILEGKYVEFGLSHYGLGVRGPFKGEHPSWDDNVNSLYLRATTIALAREALKTILKEVRGVAATGIAVNTLTDKTSGKINTWLTPGGGVILKGYRIKIDGKAAGVGLFLTNVGTGEVTQVPMVSILDNDAGLVTFIVPANLIAGEYLLSIVSQFSPSNVELKEPRTYVFDHVLTCV